MPKGKKFDAAQKHFHEKEIKLKHEMRRYEEAMKEAKNKADSLQQENERLIEENNKLKASNEILMELKGLNEEDIKILLEKAKHLKNLTSIMDILDFTKY